MNLWIIVSNGRVSEEKYIYIDIYIWYISIYISISIYRYISSSLVVIIVYGQLPPRSWSTIKIGCHYSPQSWSTISCHLNRGPPPLSDANTIQDLPLQSWSLIRDPQIIIHDVAAAAALDLQTIRQRDSGGKSQVSNIYWWDINFFNVIRIEKRKEKLEREAPCVMCPPTF